MRRSVPVVSLVILLGLACAGEPDEIPQTTDAAGQPAPLQAAASREEPPGKASPEKASAKSGPLCLPDLETIVFDCAVKGGKHASICLSPEFSADTGYAVYRFGRPGASELEVFERRSEGERRFTVTSESPTNYQSSVTLSFTNEGTRYEVSEAYGGTSGQDQEHSGHIAVTPSKGEAVWIDCASEPQGTLFSSRGDGFFPG